MATRLLRDDDLAMDKYTITGRAVRLTSGLLELNEEQSRTRLPKLRALSKTRFEIVQAVEFKRGETIGYEGDLPKSLADRMEDKSGNAGKKKSKSGTAPSAESAANQQQDETDAGTNGEGE